MAVKMHAASEEMESQIRHCGFGSQELTRDEIEQERCWDAMRLRLLAGVGLRACGACGGLVWQAYLRNEMGSGVLSTGAAMAWIAASFLLLISSV